MEKSEGSRKNITLCLITIVAAGLLLRLVYFPYDVPVALDAVAYFWYAVDTNVLGHFPSNYGFPNTGWPILLSFFFAIFHSDNFMDYMALQRLVSVSVSVLTTIPVYLICRRFFNNQIALLGAAIFALEPHTIQNSLIGISDPLYIFLIALSFVFLHSNNQKIVYLAFAMGALVSLTRYEGLLFFGVLTITFFARYRKERRVLIKYAIACSVFVIVLLPSLYLRIESTGNDGLTSHVVSGVLVTSDITVNEENGLWRFIISGFEGFITYLGWIMIPYFVILVPYGFFMIANRWDHRKLSLLLSMIVLSLPAFYAYARQIQEPRYLLVLVPFFSILSLFLIERVWKKDNNHRVILIVVLVGILISSTIFLELKKIDVEHEKEAYAIAQVVVNNTKVVNGYYPESKFLKAASIADKEFPLPSNSVLPPLAVSTDGFSSLEEFIESNSDSGLSVLIIDNNEQRPNFLRDVYLHEETYPYLIKIYDSNDYGYEYHVKIFKIDYEQFIYQ